MDFPRALVTILRVTLPQPYSHSGGIGWGVLLPVVGVCGAVVGAAPYVYANIQESVAGYFSIVLVVWLAACAAFPVAFAARILKCRNRAFLRVVSTGTALVAIYGGWTFFSVGEEGLSFPSIVDAAADPLAIWSLVSRVNASGWYEIAGVTPSGVMLGVLWVFEALIVIGASQVLALRFIDGRAYCDDCSRWCVPGKDVMVPVTAGQTMKGIRADGLGSLQAVTIPDEVSRTLQIYTWTCPRCEQFAVFGANQLHRSKGRRSIASALVEPVIPLSVRRDEDVADIERIRALLKRARAEQFAKVEIEPSAEKG